MIDNTNIERFEIVIFSENKEKTIRLQGRKTYENFKRCYVERYNVKIISDNKLYPFSQIHHKNIFRVVSERAGIAMNEMITNKVPYDENKFRLIESYKKKADKFMKLELPIAWLKWEDYKEVTDFVNEVAPVSK